MRVDPRRPLATGRPIMPDDRKAPHEGEEVPDEVQDSIYGHTDTYYTVPALNRGVPRDSAFIRALSAVEVALGVILFALIVIGVMYQVLGRYVPALGWVGAGELALLSMIAMTFVTTGYLVGRNGHIVLEVFDALLAGKRLFAVLRIVSAVIMVATCLALSYEAFLKIESEWGRASAAIHVPLGMLYVFALLGFLSAAIHSAVKIPYAHRPERKLDISEMDG
jgi:TRAP-type C4-dicarboxylate transport system permease small subunit